MTTYDELYKKTQKDLEEEYGVSADQSKPDQVTAILIALGEMDEVPDEAKVQPGDFVGPPPAAPVPESEKPLIQPDQFQGRPWAK